MHVSAVEISSHGQNADAEVGRSLDRVDVYPSKDGYTVEILRHDEVSGEASAQPLAMRSGRPRKWRDLDNLISYVLRNVSSEPSIHVHMGAKS
ncbi:hypothetical protein [Stenotrophomonas maltophilia]|uniref:hypothetical protein n=1 Tax=Stenotrophomonas maltophilia TaxID=40324 RepID=UPI00130FC27E